MKKLLIVFLAIGLCACGSLLSPVNTGCTASYELKNTPAVRIRKTHPITLLVAQPETSAIYNTHQIAYTTHPYQIAYFAKSFWIDTPPRMLQQLMIQTLQKTRYFHAVISSPIGNYNYTLRSQLIELVQDFTVNPSVVRLTLRAQLVNANTGRIVATKQFAIVTPAPQNSPYGGVVAANRAAFSLMTQLVKFCVRS